MLKTLRITCIIVAIVAGSLLVFPVVFGIRSNGQVDKLLNAPDAIEKFSKSKTDKTAANEDSVGGGPLVKQAQSLANILNPPDFKTNPALQRGSIPAPRGPIDAQFTLLGTSFSAARPELSMAFIDEPGKGFSWIRQSSKIGHLVIEQIKDGMIVIRDGQKTYEMMVQKSSDTNESILASSGSIASFTQPEKSFFSKGSLQNPIQRPSTKPVLQSMDKADMSIITEKKSSEAVLSNEQNEALEKFIEKLKDLQKDKTDKSDINQPMSTEMEEPNLTNSTEGFQDEQLKKIISDYKSERVSDEEAEKLGNMGKEVQDESK